MEVLFCSSFPLSPSTHLINGHEIIRHRLPWAQTLINDIGGHGRALKALSATLKDWNVGESFDRNRESDPAFYFSILSTFRYYLSMNYQN